MAVLYCAGFFLLLLLLLMFFYCFFCCVRCFLVFAGSIINGFSKWQCCSPKSSANKTNDYYPLWKYVTKIKQMLGGGTWEWRCNLCTNGKTYKGSYSRVGAHILHEGVKRVCSHTSKLEVRVEYKREHDDAQRLKDQKAKISTSSRGGFHNHYSLGFW